LNPQENDWQILSQHFSAEFQPQKGQPIKVAVETRRKIIVGDNGSDDTYEQVVTSIQIGGKEKLSLWPHMIDKLIDLLRNAAPVVKREHAKLRGYQPEVQPRRTRRRRDGSDTARTVGGGRVREGHGS